jgi:anti-sigma B factor antagonist
LQVLRGGHQIANRQIGPIKPPNSVLKGRLPLLIKKTENAAKPGIKIVAGEEQPLVCLSGAVDMDSSPAIRNQLLTLLQDSAPKNVSIDLSAVTHIDSSGLATLIEALRIARTRNTMLRLQGLNDRLLRFFELTGLLPLFNGSV